MIILYHTSFITYTSNIAFVSHSLYFFSKIISSFSSLAICHILRSKSHRCLISLTANHYSLTYTISLTTRNRNHEANPNYQQSCEGKLQ